MICGQFQKSPKISVADEHLQQRQRKNDTKAVHVVIPIAVAKFKIYNIRATNQPTTAVPVEVDLGCAWGLAE
jgi:hypothetical protein